MVRQKSNIQVTVEDVLGDNLKNILTKNTFLFSKMTMHDTMTPGGKVYGQQYAITLVTTDCPPIVEEEEVVYE